MVIKATLGGSGRYADMTSPCLHVAALLLLAAPFGLGACASMDTGTGAEVVGDAVQQPFRDLNLIRDQAPAVLVRAADRPYAHQSLEACAELKAEIAELERLLGPDIDTGVTEQDNDAVAIASDAIRGLFDLPFRGVVRRLTGAYDRDAAIRRAVLAGMVRRGYLKGLVEERGCERPAAVPAATPAAATASTDASPIDAGLAPVPQPVIDPGEPSAPSLAF